MKKIKPYNVTTIGHGMTGTTVMAQAIIHKLGELSEEELFFDQANEPEGIKINDLDNESFLLTRLPVSIDDLYILKENYSSRRERRKSERNNKKRNG